MNRKSPARLAFLVILILFVPACHEPLRTAAPTAQPPDPAREPRWDRIFERDSGWTGADVAASCAIPENRVLWIFGDTFIGKVENNRRFAAVVVHNSIAVHPYDPARSGEPPAPQDVHFYWGPPDSSGAPTAWISSSSASSGTATTWYWPTGGAAVFPAAQQHMSLALFLIKMEKMPGDTSMWSFRTVSGAVAVVDDAGVPAQAWRPRVTMLPRTPDPVSGQGRIADWGKAALYESGGQEDGIIYIYGVASGGSAGNDLVLARVCPESLTDFSTWEFFSAGGWVASPGAAGVLADNMSTEFSVEHLSYGPVNFVMVYSDPSLGANVLVRTAPAPQGPWSDPVAAFTAPEVQGSESRFAYAAKGHVAISAPGALLITYVVNTNDILELFDDASLYRPYFVSVPLQNLMIGK